MYSYVDLSYEQRRMNADLLKVQSFFMGMNTTGSQMKKVAASFPSFHKAVEKLIGNGIFKIEARGRGGETVLVFVRPAAEVKLEAAQAVAQGGPPVDGPPPQGGPLPGDIGPNEQVGGRKRRKTRKTRRKTKNRRRRY